LYPSGRQNTIFTLNYDWTFERLGADFSQDYELVDGFEPLGGEWKPSRFSSGRSAEGQDQRSPLQTSRLDELAVGGPVKSMSNFDSGTPSTVDEGPL
jgi:hypothetical protein